MPPQRTCVLAERAMNTRLQGGCQVPIGGYAIEQDGKVFLRALVGETDGSAIIAQKVKVRLKCRSIRCEHCRTTSSTRRR